MKLTQRQKDDLATVMYFLPKTASAVITDEDIEAFFLFSEQGKKKEKTNPLEYTGFDHLCEGKRWRGIHIHELWEPGVLSGEVPYAVLLDPKPPREVVNFMKKEMFGGIDAELIEKVYSAPEEKEPELTKEEKGMLARAFSKWRSGLLSDSYANNQPKRS